MVAEMGFVVGLEDISFGAYNGSTSPKDDGIETNAAPVQKANSSPRESGFGSIIFLGRGESVCVESRCRRCR